MAFYCGSLGKFMKHDLGLSLINGEKFIADVYASALGAPNARMGAIIH